jgi:hypothetical protein
VHIEFNDEQDEIRLEGPPEDVEQAEKIIKDQTAELVLHLIDICNYICHDMKTVKQLTSLTAQHRVLARLLNFFATMG